MTVVLGVDVGGTFTDCIVADENGGVHLGKAFSTPDDYATGFMASIEAVAKRHGSDASALLSSADGVYHGCTVGTNALVEGRTAKVGLLTTRGHRDSILVMKSGRRLRGLPHEVVADVAQHDKPSPMVPKRLIREIDERVAADGSVVVAIDEDGARAAVRGLIAEGVEAFAVSLLWSVANDSHERMVAEIIRDELPGAFVSIASSVILRAGEYERTVATVVNALIGPVMDGYLGGLEQKCAAHGYHGKVQIMTCSGGLISTDEARKLPVVTIGSGPVAGLIGSHRVAVGLAVDGTNGNSGADGVNIITGDLGGTTFDVGVVHHGVPRTRRTSWHGQYEYFVPTLDVRSVGSGGGSIIRFDAASGSLRVGPQSAGAVPGPVCIQRGGLEPTVTDANLVAGIFDPEYFLGGEVKLDVEAAREALARIGQPIGLGAEAAAAAALRIVDNQMADAIRLASVQQGLDPRRFVLHAYGGGGPVHGAAVARHVGMSEVVVPLSDLAAGWSAFGIAGARPLVVQEVADRMNNPFDPALLNSVWRRLEAEAIERMVRQGNSEDQLALTRHVDMRYSLQVNEVEVEAPGGCYGEGDVADLIARFESEYERLFGEGTGYAEAGFSIIGMRVRCRAEARDQSGASTGSDPSRTVQPQGRREVIFYDTGLEPEEVPIYRGEAPKPGTVFAGPAIVELPDTTVVVPHRSTARIDQRGSMTISLEER